MEYYISVVKGNDRKIVSRHSNLQDALKEGELFWRDSPKDRTVSCISGTLNEAGELVGKYKLYECWFCL